MSEPIKQPDAERDEDDARIPSYLVNDVDDVLFEVREFLVNSVLASPGPKMNRIAAIKRVAQILQEFSSGLNQHIQQASEKVQIQGLAELLLNQSAPRLVDESLQQVGQLEGKRLLHQHLSQLPFPHYEANPGDSATVVQILEDGTRTVGRFVNRQFVAVEND